MRIGLFGHFGRGNFGNDSTLQAMVYHLRRVIPNAEITCICTGPEAVAAAYKIKAEPISDVVVQPWKVRSSAVKLVRRLLIGIPCELYRWFRGFMILRGTHVFIIAGTGLLTDAYSLWGSGPYNVFKWSVAAKLCRCKLLFVSVGAGPVYGVIGKWLVKSSLSLADFRSYRDEASMQYVKSMGLLEDGDQVYPDLAFSLPEDLISNISTSNRQRRVVGLGLMNDPGRYAIDRPDNAVYRGYLDSLAVFVKWLLAHNWDVRLLIGDVGDRPTTQEFRSLLKTRSVICEEGRIIEEPIASAENVLSQLAATDLVVATRFHNALLALLLNKPVISISFHHKCSSLMSRMGLSEYCQDISELNGDTLIELFCKLEKNAAILKPMIRQRAEECRKALDDQYSLIFQGVDLGNAQVVRSSPVEQA